MIGNYLRVTPAQLGALFADASGITAFLDADHPDDARLDIDKSWHAIHFLLNGTAWEGAGPFADVVLGGQEIGDEDVGYGPARGLTPDEVQRIAAALATVSEEELWSRFDPAKLAEAEIYPKGWDAYDPSEDESSKAYLLGYYAELRAFFRRAAEAGDALVVYLG